MKRRMKQLLCLVLALSLMGQFLPVMARADSAGDQLKRLELERFERVVEVNPLYADVITVEEPDRAPERDYSLSAAASASEIADFDEATAILRAGLVAREPEILVTYSIDDYDEDLFNRIFDAARVHTGNPKEGDCLDWGWETIVYEIGAYSFTEGYLVLVFTPTYYTTPEQERELDAAVDALLATVDRSAGAYDQIKTVYDYICANITYDYDNLNDKSYTLKFTPYAALVNGTAVCQGYALLLYRLALELGIDARLIAGSSEGDGNQDHGWNILCIDGKYYNADSTWDAGGSVYSWFLQSEEHFTRGYTGHIRSTKYDTAEFHAAYPMSGTDYDPDALPVDPNLVAEGTCGDGVFWRLTKDGTLTVSGEGDMTDYTYLFDGQPWREYAESITAIRVEGTVNSIGSFAFAGMDNQSLVIEDGVESIGEYAFCGCPELTEVTIPDSVTTVDSFAFHDCVSLTRVQIGKGTTGIGDFVFGSCGSMREINVHEENPCYSSDSRGVLFDRNRTVLIYAPGALEGSYSVPEGVTSIRNSAFSDCDRMTELDLPDSVTTVGEWAFSGCASMTRMDMGNGVLTIGNSAFRDCISLTGLVIPDSVTTVGQETFSGCNSLARLEIGSGVTRMDNWAVEACPSLREILFRGSAPSFGKNVFANVTAVVHYPGNDPTWTDAVKQDHGGSLAWVPYAQEVASGWSGYTQWTLTDDGLLTFTGSGNMGNYDSYEARPWDAYTDQITAVVITSGVTSIGRCAFMGLTELETVTLPETGLVQICEDAFVGCSSLIEIIVPGSVTSIGHGAFRNCSSMKKAVIQEGVNYIDSDVFEQCNSLVEIIIPQSIISIGQSAFYYCSSLISVSIPESVTCIDYLTFLGCSRLKSITIPENVTSIAKRAFCACDSLDVVFYKGTEKQRYEINIDDYNDILSSATWHYEVTDVIYEGNPAYLCGKCGHYYAPDGTKLSCDHDYVDGICTHCGAKDPDYVAPVASGWSGYTQWTLTDDGVLRIYGTGNMKNYHYNGGQPWLDKGVDITSVVVETGVTAIGSGAFRNLTTLESVTLPEKGLTKIGEAAFYGCTGLKQIHIPDGIYTVWAYTFKNCTALESVRLPKTLLKIDQGAFENCTALPYVFIPGDTHTIGSWSFKGCTGLEEADMQWTDATEIREGAFKNCSALNTILLPSGIEIFGDSCFYGIGATSFEVPATVTQIRAWCFARAYSLTEITFAGDAPAIGEGAFNKITLTARYPSGNSTWDGAVKQSYGGEVIWEAA